MRVVFDRPPNFPAILARFPMAKTHGVLFAYGAVIFNPDSVRIAPELFVHEGVHGARQMALPGGVEEWWRLYLAEPAFCLAEEVPAHQAEWQAVLHGVPLPSRSREKKMLALIAARLSGPLYNHAISLQDAVALLGGDTTLSYGGLKWTR